MGIEGLEDWREERVYSLTPVELFSLRVLGVHPINWLNELFLGVGSHLSRDLSILPFSSLSYRWRLSSYSFCVLLRFLDLGIVTSNKAETWVVTLDLELR